MSFRVVRKHKIVPCIFEFVIAFRCILYCF